jgi:cytochrome b subunit of formate dehydrogenase
MREVAPDDMILSFMNTKIRGVFVKHTVLPLSLAWVAYGENNGTESLSQLRYGIAEYRGKSMNKYRVIHLLGAPFWLNISIGQENSVFKFLRVGQRILFEEKLWILMIVPCDKNYGLVSTLNS